MDTFAKLRTDKYFTPKEVDDLSIISKDNHTLLQEAIAWRKELVVELIEAGVPLNHQDNNGQTALQYAISRSLFDIAMLLIKKDVDQNLLDKYGNNALWTAVMLPKPDYAVVAALVKAGVTPDHKNLAGRSSNDMARTKKNKRLIEILGGQADIS